MRTWWWIAASLLLAACGSLLGDPAGEPAPPTFPSSPPSSTAPVTGGSAPPQETTTSSTSTPPPATTLPLPLRALAFEEIASELGFPVGIEQPSGDGRLFFVLKEGRIVIWEDGRIVDGAFLDISPLVRDRGEQGLLGLAFHPDYQANGRFFVHYSDRAGNTRVEEYLVSDDPDRADPDSARLILAVEQPAANHNGGQLSFGPDGYLYLGLGDGGGANDQFGNGQRPDTLLGTILRLDVDGEVPYGIPSDNPFIDGGGAPEVWAFGLRNPWRFSFDEGLIYIGDVGQNRFEEIDVAPADAGGLNYGWPITEGLHCFRPGTDCSTTGLTLPLFEVSQSDAGSCSITGGVVYRGATIPEIAGHYLYSDFCGGWLRSFRYADGGVADATDWTAQVGIVGRVTSFGRDSDGEVYVAVADGRILKLVAER